jgi:hypothetical protein
MLATPGKVGFASPKLAKYEAKELALLQNISAVRSIDAAEFFPDASNNSIIFDVPMRGEGSATWYVACSFC